MAVFILIFIKIYLSHFIPKRNSQYVVSFRDRWGETYSEKGLLLTPYLLPGASRCQRLHPLASCIARDDTNASDRLRIPGSSLDSDWTDCLNLTAWFSYHVVSFRLHTCSTDLPWSTATPCLLITAWQLLKALRVTGDEPKIHVNSHYITNHSRIFKAKSGFIHYMLNIYDLVGLSIMAYQSL